MSSSSQQPYYNASNSQPVVVQGTLVPNPPNSNNNAPGHIYDHEHAIHGIGSPHTSLQPHHPFHLGETSTTTDDPEDGHWQKGVHQPTKRCNDGIFAILFIVHLVVMASLSIVYAPQMIGEVADNVANYNNYQDRDLLVELELVELEDGESIRRDEEGEGQQSLGIKFASFIAKSANHFISLSSSSNNNNDNNYYLGQHEEQQQRRDLEENDNVSGTNDMSDMMLLLGISALIALVISTAALSVMISHAQTLIKIALVFNIASTAVVSDICIWFV